MRNSSCICSNHFHCGIYDPVVPTSSFTAVIKSHNIPCQRTSGMHAYVCDSALIYAPLTAQGWFFSVYPGARHLLEESRRELARHFLEALGHRHISVLGRRLPEWVLHWVRNKCTARGCGTVPASLHRSIYGGKMRISRSVAPTRQHTTSITVVVSRMVPGSIENLRCTVWEYRM